MPERETKFVVNAAPAELWRFIRDFHALCTCIPGVERIRQVDQRTAELTIREKIGVVPMIVDLVARIEAEVPPRSLHAVARAEHLTIEIDVALQASGAGTELHALFKVTGEGPLKPIVDRLFERRATERATQFAECLEKRFGAARPQGAVRPGEGVPDPARGFFGPLAGWLARVRRFLAGPRL